jgi:hypothetical protein
MTDAKHPDHLSLARHRMTKAKARFSEAAKAVLRGDHDAGTLARIALAEVETAREQLRRLADAERQRQ